MLIVSDYKDYYDSIARNGIDNTIVYQRKESRIPFGKPNDYREYDRYLKTSDGLFNTKLPDDLVHGDTGLGYLTAFIVGFCGKIYTGAEITPKNGKTFFSYELDEIRKYHEDFGTNRWYRSKREILKFSFLNKDYSFLFQHFKVPIFVLYYDAFKSFSKFNSEGRPINSGFFLNRQLKDLEFYKVFDPYRTFQEIQMYISGVLGTNQNPTENIEDKYRIKQYGFDEWSFRNQQS